MNIRRKIMNKFEIKMDNGDIHIVESSFTIEEISDEIVN